MTFSSRLAQAMYGAGFPSIRAFQQALPREAKGTSYASVYAYIKGDTPPPDEFVAVAARTLGVRAGWLATGQGSMAVQAGDPENAVPSCGSCRFWRPDAVWHNTGECRRHAPIAIDERRMHPNASWPVTWDHDWCGDQRPRQKDDVSPDGRRDPGAGAAGKGEENGEAGEGIGSGPAAPATDVG